jgi:hypothetical protein
MTSISPVLVYLSLPPYPPFPSPTSLSYSPMSIFPHSLPQTSSTTLSPPLPSPYPPTLASQSFSTSHPSFPHNTVSVLIPLAPSLIKVDAFIPMLAELFRIPASAAHWPRFIPIMPILVVCFILIPLATVITTTLYVNFVILSGNVPYLQLIP